jgi:hypothetical protein
LNAALFTGNSALTVREDVCHTCREGEVFCAGNPPFLGRKSNLVKKEDLERYVLLISKIGPLDFVL